jgi:hypothetical protein
LHSAKARGASATAATAAAKEAPELFLQLTKGFV